MTEQDGYKYQIKLGEKLYSIRPDAKDNTEYEVIEHMGYSTCETYKAKIIKTNLSMAGYRNTKEVVIKIPIINTSKPPEEIIAKLGIAMSKITNENRFLDRLKPIDCVAHLIDYGIFQLSHPSVSFPMLVEFLVQEFIAGEQLDKAINKIFAPNAEFKGIPNANDFLKWAKKLADGLVEIHENGGITHGDIWPQNIMVDSDQKVIFIDFGQAHFRELAVSSIGTTTGTPRSFPYLAPEDCKPVSADIYSLGAVLFYLAIGKAPSESIRQTKDNNELKNKIQDEIKHNNSALFNANCGIADIISRCLRRKELERPLHARGVLQDIEIFSKYLENEDSINFENETNLLNKFNKANISSLFKWMARLYINPLNTILNDMMQGYYDLKGDREVVVSTLTQYLSFIGNGDKYLTVSVPCFWESRNLGINGRFLSMNKIIAQRKATIRRIFILTQEEIENDDRVRKIIKSHIKIMDELQEIGIDTLSTDIKTGGYYTGYVLRTFSEREKIVKDANHFGLLIKENHKILMIPIGKEEEEDKTIVANVLFHSNPDKVKEKQNYFNQLLEESKDIRSLTGSIGR